MSGRRLDTERARIEDGRADRPQPRWSSRAIRGAGGLVVLYGTAHTLGGLTVEGAARHAGSWLGGELRGQSLETMSPAMSAYWLTVNSFGPPLVLLGATVLWLDRHGVTPPPFIAWALAGWVLVDTVVEGPGVGQNLMPLTAAGLLLAAARRDRPADARRSPRTRRDPVPA